MSKPDKESWLERLSDAGLTVVKTPPPTDIAAPLKAWRGAVNIDAEPVAKVRQSAPDALIEVDRQWFTHALNASIFAPDQSFLISVAGPGSLEFGWAHVKWTNDTTLAPRLVQDDGSVEFLAMSIDGRRTCAVTTEEYDFWILTGEVE